jgi:hypothetical protein
MININSIPVYYDIIYLELHHLGYKNKDITPMDYDI